MKRIKLMAAAAIMAVVATAGYMGYTAYEYATMTPQERMILANIEALTSSPEFQTIYNREEGSCTINVGVKGSIKLLGGTILTADANGNVTFDGKVICSGGGNSSCTPVECVDLYETILK